MSQGCPPAPFPQAYELDFNSAMIVGMQSDPSALVRFNASVTGYAKGEHGGETLHSRHSGFRKGRYTPMRISAF